MTQNRSWYLSFQDLFFPDMTGWGFELELCSGMCYQVFQHVFIASLSLIFLRGINKQQQRPLCGHEAHLNSFDNYFSEFSLRFFSWELALERAAHPTSGLRRPPCQREKDKEKGRRKIFNSIPYFLQTCFWTNKIGFIAGWQICQSLLGIQVRLQHTTEFFNSQIQLVKIWIIVDEFLIRAALTVINHRFISMHYF